MSKRLEIGRLLHLEKWRELLSFQGIVSVNRGSLESYYRRIISLIDNIV